MAILHPCHIHPLMLKVEERSDSEDEVERNDNVCLICLQRLGRSFIYECEKCRFPVHKYCAEFPTKINHPFHPHSLILIDLHSTGKMRSGWFKFICSKSTLARLVNNGQFEVELFLEKNGVSPCCACGGMNRYSLRPSILPQIPASGECEFNLDFKCAALELAPEKFRMPSSLTLQHEHRLIACTNKLNEYHYSCFRCGEDFDEDDYIYICLECKCLLHESCAALPDQIRHPLHSQHVLRLLFSGETETFICNICSLDYLRTERIFYGCSMCDFKVDMWCAKLEVDQRKVIDEGLSHSPPHQCHCHHSLIQCASLKNFPRPCFACRGTFYDKDSIFVCLQCSILLHTSCIDPPAEIVHLFHPQHPLQFRLQSGSSSWLESRTESKCNRCWSSHGRYFYVCDDCKFCLDLRCATRKPDILSSEIHEHPLAFGTLYFDNMIRCLHCRNRFDDDLALRCCRSECNYNIHPHCLPSLPETFKHDCHIHPLTLSRSCIKELPDDILDEDAKFYCYACEKERDLDHPCYYCTSEDCIFVAHVHCLICKIVSCMQKSSKNVVSEQSAASSVVLEEEVPATSTAEVAKDDKSKIETTLTGFAEDVVMEKRDCSNVATEEAQDSTVMGSMDLTAKLETPATEDTENEAMTESASSAVVTGKAQVSTLQLNIHEIDQEIAAAEQEIDARTRKINQLRGKREQMLSNSGKQFQGEN